MYKILFRITSLNSALTKTDLTVTVYPTDGSTHAFFYPTVFKMNDLIFISGRWQIDPSITLQSNVGYKILKLNGISAVYAYGMATNYQKNRVLGIHVNPYGEIYITDQTAESINFADIMLFIKLS